MLNITNIPSARVTFIDPQTNLMSRSWYRFFFNLFVLTGSGQPPAALTNITVTASPFVYTNTADLPVSVIVNGGSVSNLEFSRDGVIFFNLGSYYGMFGLSPGDQLRATYTSPPTMTLVPR